MLVGNSVEITEIKNINFEKLKFVMVDNDEVSIIISQVKFSISILVEDTKAVNLYICFQVLLKYTSLLSALKVFNLLS